MEKTDMDKEMIRCGMTHLQQMNNELTVKYGDTAEAFALLIGSVAYMVQGIVGFIKEKRPDDQETLDVYKQLILGTFEDGKYRRTSH